MDRMKNFLKSAMNQKFIFWYELTKEDTFPEKRFAEGEGRHGAF
ncbi:MAG: hypothetical protein QGH50_15120 [SAR324 cluster bacterium]|nr:hypothetical protein [SAR324 cluster bacterium]